MPTKTFSAIPLPENQRRRRAWFWVLVNQLAFPGLGTILSGRKAGYLQAAIMVCGFCLAMGFMIIYFRALTRLAMGASGNEVEFRAAYAPRLWMMRWGVGLTVFAWFWAWFSSIAILRDLNRGPALSPPKGLP